VRHVYICDFTISILQSSDKVAGSSETPVIIYAAKTPDKPVWFRLFVTLENFLKQIQGQRLKVGLDKIFLNLSHHYSLIMVLFDATLGDKELCER